MSPWVILSAAKRSEAAASALCFEMRGGSGRGVWWLRGCGYHWAMAVSAKKLDLTVGELVEIGGRRYEVVPDRRGGVTLEPPITPAGQLHAERGTRPASVEDFERLSSDVPLDDEG
jgi:hypothetical protein